MKKQKKSLLESVKTKFADSNTEDVVEQIEGIEQIEKIEQDVSVETVEKNLDNVKTDAVDTKEVKDSIIQKEPVQVDTNLAMIFLSSLSDLLLKLSKRVITVTKYQEDYKIPQAVVLIDPRTMKPLNPADLVSVQSVSINGIGGTGSSGIAQSVAIRGAGAIGDGTATVTTAGTPVQLPSVSVSRVYLQANPSNTGEIVVGSSSVIASASTRRGVAIFSTQWVEFKVDNLNKLYIDATVSGDKINYTYEI